MDFLYNNNNNTLVNNNTKLLRLNIHYIPVWSHLLPISALSTHYSELWINILNENWNVDTLASVAWWSCSAELWVILKTNDKSDFRVHLCLDFAIKKSNLISIIDHIYKFYVVWFDSQNCFHTLKRCELSRGILLCTYVVINTDLLLSDTRCVRLCICA